MVAFNSYVKLPESFFVDSLRIDIIKKYLS